MAKYCFKLYLQNGDVRTVVPANMQATDLFNMDQFVSKQGGYFELCETLAKELNITVYEIKKITIFQIQRQTEFSVITSNPYLIPVLSSLENKKIWGYGNYQIDATVVPMTHANYLEMKNYLFQNLQKDYQYFLGNIYTYSNQFAKLLYQYGSVYHQGLLMEEDQRNIKELENKISIGLSLYKNYRGLSQARKKSEDKISYHVNLKDTKTKNLNITEYSSRLIDYQLERYSVPIKTKVENYNREHEEFLEEEEFQQMFDDRQNYR